MEKSLETHNLSRLTQEEIESLKRPIIRKEIESVVENLPVKKILFNGEFYQTSEEINTNPSGTLPKNR